MAADPATPEGDRLPPGPPDDWFVSLGRIEREVLCLEEHRQAWRNLSTTGALGAAGGSGPSCVTGASGGYDWLGQLYFRSQALGVRRMVDGDRRAGSFKRLLHKMTEDCPQLTRSWFVELAEAGKAAEAGEAEAQFTGHADPWQCGHLDSEVPREDLRVLEAACNGIKRYVDQYVTHAQLDPDVKAPEPAEVDAAIDILLSLLGKYTLLLRPGRQGWGNSVG